MNIQDQNKKQVRKIYKFYWRHMMTQKWQMLGVFVLIGLGSIIAMVRPILLKDFIDTIGGNDPSPEIKGRLLVIMAIIIATMILRWFTKRSADFIGNKAHSKIHQSILRECFLYTQQHSVDFFDNTFIGSLIKKLNRAPRVYDTLSEKFIWNFWPMLIRLLVVFVVLSLLNIWLGVSIFVWIIGFVVINWKLSLYKLKYDYAWTKAETQASSAQADTLTNHRNVKYFSALDYEYKRYDKSLDRLRNTALRAWNIETSIDAAQGLLMVSIDSLILFVSIQLWSNGALTVGEIVLIQSYLLETFFQLWNLGKHIRAISERLADGKELLTILETPHAIQDLPEAKDLIVKSGNLELQNVNFKYGPDLDYVFKNLNIHVKSGEKIALVGPSGGGKSTLIKIILRLFDINSGEILVDKQNIARVTQSSLRTQIALVPQDPILFHRSIADNIAYGRRGASRQEIVEAAKLARCHDFIIEQKNGYDTFVGERGIKLSGGQRQRVAIARAILANAQILILDEATSSLDSESETLIQEALDNLMKNKTTIIVAHRLSTIMKADRILVLEKGKIIEEGSHADLLNKNNSLYKRLWNLQVGGYLE